MDRTTAWNLVREYTNSDSLRKHMLAVEAAMRAYARKFGEDEEKFGVVGLLHDFDYERWPDPPHHPLEGAAILARLGCPDEIIYAIKSHADYLTDCPRLSLLDKTLYACDELAGFIMAVAHVRPEGLTGMKASSVKKKMKSKGFAAAINREDIARGAADLGVELDEHLQFVIDALATIAPELGFPPTMNSPDTNPTPAAPDVATQATETHACSTSAPVADLTARRCVPCEGGVPRWSREQCESQLATLHGWTLTADGQRIRKQWRVKHFLAGMDFFQRVAELAEAEGHHPDLHLEGYRHVTIEIWTHAIGGLSENDFILAAKIDQLPIKLGK